MGTAGRFIPHYSVKDYELWEGEWELWRGIPVAMTPSPFGGHSKVLARAVAVLLGAIEAAEFDATVLPELDWVISSDTVVRPDVSVTCGPEPERYLESPPCLVIEVLSDSPGIVVSRQCEPYRPALGGRAESRPLAGDFLT